MNISVELTLTPLQDNYEELIIGFIKKIRASGFTVLENPLLCSSDFIPFTLSWQLLVSSILKESSVSDSVIFQMYTLVYGLTVIVL